MSEIGVEIDADTTLFRMVQRAAKSDAKDPMTTPFAKLAIVLMMRAKKVGGKESYTREEAAHAVKVAINELRKPKRYRKPSWSTV